MNAPVKIHPSTIDHAKSDIVAVISKYVDLKKNGSEFSACCPFHNERTPSFTVQPEKQFFYCFGCGASGDAVDFVSTYENIGFREAVESIVGNVTPVTLDAATVNAPVRAQKDPEWTPQVPVPADTAQQPMDTLNRRKGDGWERLTASQRWEYRDAAGELIGYVCRFELPGGGKDVMPQSFCVNSQTGEVSWRWMSFAKPRPMYGLDKLAKHPNAQVMVVEGEKAADAAQAHYEAAGIDRDKLVTVSWPGGSKAVKHTDWSPLHGRKVGLWPDADQKNYAEGHAKAGQAIPVLEQAGVACMLHVAELLAGNAKTLKLIEPPAGVSDGWDLADELPEGWDLLAHTKAAASDVEAFREKHAAPAEAVVEPPAHVTEELPAADQVVQHLDAVLSYADVEELPEGTPWIGQPMSVQADRTPVAGGSTSVLSSATLAGCEELGILPLGTISDMYAFWRRDTGTLELIRAKDVGSESSFLRLATKQGWEFWCTENGGKYDRSAIANALIQASKLLGQMELSRIPSSLATLEHVEAEYARAMLAVKPSAGMLSQMIAAHPDWKGADLWFDEFANDIKSTGEPPCGGGAGSWTDHHDVLMCGWVAAQWGANVSKSCAAEAVLLLAAQNKRHPVREYLNGLTWDGTPRLDTWLVDLVGCPADIYTQAVGPKTLIGAVARVMRPGCKHDTVLILEGEQGKRKSTLVASLLPNDAWFAEDLGADIGSKDAMDGLAGKWIVELAELANMEKSESKAIKSFIARKTDRYRPSYGKRSMDFKRQTILIGTVNPEGDGRYLKDPTGGRRFWPIKCGDINIERAVEIRDQLWAEAAARFKNGESWWLNDEQEAAASKVQSERQEDNHWLDRVERYLTHFAPTGQGAGWGAKRASKLQVVVVSDIFEAVIGRPYMKRDVSESRNIADALRSLGWQYKPSGYIEGRKCRHWAAPGYRGHDEDAPF